jgi:hypothetical protein
MQPAFYPVSADIIPARTGMAIARAGERIASCGEYLALGMQQMVIVVAAGMLTCVAGVLGVSVFIPSRMCLFVKQSQFRLLVWESWHAFHAAEQPCPPADDVHCDVVSGCRCAQGFSTLCWGA